MKGDSKCRDSVIGTSWLFSYSCSQEWLRACSGLGSYSSRWRSAFRQTLTGSVSTFQPTMRTLANDTEELALP